MIERGVPQNVPRERMLPKSAFEDIAPFAPLELVNFLKLAEKEGAYGKLSLKTKRMLEMRYVEGLDMSQIGDVLEISKQAVSQTLKHTPESLYKKMARDVITYKTNIPFREIISAYSNYRIELEASKAKVR